MKITMRKGVALAGVVALLAAIGMGAAYATLPTTTVPETSVPAGVLVGGTPIDVASVSAFARAINQDQGTNVVLSKGHLEDGGSTGWHTHPGPNLVMVVSGGLNLTDANCHTTFYPAGTAFATGLGVHEAVAVGPTDFYALYLLPGQADVLRTDASAPRCAA